MKTTTTPNEMKGKPCDRLVDKLRDLNARFGTKIGTAAGFTYRSGSIGGRFYVDMVDEKTGGFDVLVPLTDSLQITDTLTMLECYARGDKFVLLRQALGNVEQLNKLQAVADVLVEYENMPISGSTLHRKLVAALFGQGHDSAGAALEQFAKSIDADAAAIDVGNQAAGLPPAAPETAGG